ncbi:SgcJ/EcaC family oxidoreductase [Kribbella albertanoniae]|uniref:SgcJ/EcaC family oxidoreductase n=1 Tax=Kribbella albertanoniae TaxID=1266829 RepID=A0A4R4PM11_9ACTN|nr:SgcJ/EcaC family oxidoreductase [Kribbella albertanoniae]
MTALTACSSADAATAARPTTQEITALFDQWNTALKGDAQGVADLYADNGVLLPTLSPVVRTDREQIKEYFVEDFLPKKPTGTITESHVRVIDEDSASHSGNYTFTLTDKDGDQTKVDARFTYIYEKIDGKWLITEHHSSVTPDKP